MRKKLINLVNKVLSKNPSGEEFFNKIDHEFSNDFKLIEYYISKIDSSIYNLVLTGKFGKRISELIDSGKLKKYNYILYNGGIRKGAKPECIINNIDNSKKMIFLDDSYYSGKTYFEIKKHIYENISKRISHVYVIYDGSKHKNIKSLYRYYNYY